MGPADKLAHPQLKVDTEPRRLLVTTEPYVVFTALGYQAAMDVYERKTKRHWSIYIGAVSISKSLCTLVNANAGSAIGLEFWINKESDDRKSRYILSE